MIWSNVKLSPEVRSLLDSERGISVLPAAARGRAVSRARAALAAGVARRPVPSRAPSSVRWAAAAGLACVATVAASAAAYTIGLRSRRPVDGAPSAEFAAPHPRAADEPLLDVVSAPVREATPGQSKVGAVRLELRLLQQARAAVAREDFPLAIQLLAEHARWFKTGRLVEERSAAHQVPGGARPPRRRPARSSRLRGQFPAQPSFTDGQRDARFDALTVGSRAPGEARMNEIRSRLPCEPHPVICRDAVLVAGVVRGEIESATVIWERYSSLVGRILRRVFGSSPDSVDLSQDVFLCVFQQMTKLRQPEALRSYIVGICLRVARNHLRRKKVRAIVGLTENIDLLPSPAVADPDTRDAVRRLCQLLDGLTAEDQIAVHEPLRRRDAGRGDRYPSRHDLPHGSAAARPDDEARVLASEARRGALDLLRRIPVHANGGSSNCTRQHVTCRGPRREALQRTDGPGRSPSASCPRGRTFQVHIPLLADSYRR